MKNFDHPNVLNVLGAGFDNDNGSGLPFILLPFMANGDLKNYLKNKRQNPAIVDCLPEVCVATDFDVHICVCVQYVHTVCIHVLIT